MHHLCPQSNSHALPRHYFTHLSHTWPYIASGGHVSGSRARVSKIRTRKGAEVSLVAHVGARGHILRPTKVNQIDTIFTKMLSKTVKRGVPLFLLPFWEAFGHPGTPPPPPCGPSEVVLLQGGPSPLGAKLHLEPKF